MCKNNLVLKHGIYITIIALTSLTIGVITGLYIPKLQANIQEKKAEQAKIEEQKADEILATDRVLDKKEFSIKVPAGWDESTTMPSTSATVTAVKEEITDPALQKINFKSYYAVTYDVLKSGTPKQYLAATKQNLPKIIPGIKFSNEQEIEVNGQKAYTVEATANQRGADFNVLIAVIKGKNQDIWNLSFNTGVSYWPVYKDVFYSIVNSFIIK